MCQWHAQISLQKLSEQEQTLSGPGLHKYTGTLYRYFWLRVRRVPSYCSCASLDGQTESKELTFKVPLFFVGPFGGQLPVPSPCIQNSPAALVPARCSGSMCSTDQADPVLFSESFKEEGWVNFLGFPFLARILVQASQYSTTALNEREPMILLR